MYDVSGMTHKEMNDLVHRRLQRLAMCKRGAIESDCNKQLDALGPCPSYTQEERDEINAKMEKTLQKALTPTASMMKKAKGDIERILNMLGDRARKIRGTCFVHPDKAAWELKKKQIDAQRHARIAVCDADFQDVEDEYILGVKSIDTLPADLLKLEQREW